FAFDRAATRALHELFLLQRMQLLLRRGERAEPEHLPDDGSVLEQRLLRSRKRVEPRRDDSLHRLRQLLGAAALLEHPHELLGVEWVAARLLEQPPLRLRFE